MVLNNKKVRLFISIELSEEIRKEIAKFVRKLKRSYWPVRWVASQNIHITLAFLGWSEQDSVLHVSSHVSQAVQGINSFEIKIRGIGCFPDERRPRVIWVGLVGDLEALGKLQKRVGEELEKAGFKIEERKFIPHLTLGRVQKGTGAPALRNLGRQIGKMSVGEFKNIIGVEKVSVIQSVLRRSGPIYKELASVKLKIKNEV